jgi:hypothetical protein
VFRGQTLVIAAQSQAMRRLDETARAVGIVFQIHVSLALLDHTRFCWHAIGDADDDRPTLTA